MFHKTSFRKKHAMIMIAVPWLFGPLFTVSRLIPTTRVTPDGICIQNLSWPSPFWFTFASIIICIVTLLLSVFLYFILIFFHIYFFTKKSGKRRWDKPSLGNTYKSKGKCLCHSCIFSVLDLEYLLLLSIQCWRAT